MERPVVEEAKAAERERHTEPVLSAADSAARAHVRACARVCATSAVSTPAAARAPLLIIPRGFALREPAPAAPPPARNSSPPPQPPPPPGAPTVLGWREPVVLCLPEGGSAAVALRAKIDTGAHITAVDARDVERFERAGRPWVRFALAPGRVSRDVGAHSAEPDGAACADWDADVDADAPVVLEREIVRTALIKRSDGGPPQRRPVVIIPLCLGSFCKDAEIGLTDRSGLSVPLLVGRAFLGGSFVVDPRRKNTLDAQTHICARMQGRQ